MGKDLLKKPELLAPAGSFDGMRAAINAGADAFHDKIQNSIEDQLNSSEYSELKPFVESRDLNKDMPLVGRTVIITVDYTDRIIELDSKLKSESASRKDHEYPPVFDPGSDSGRDLYGLTGRKDKVER